jgi:mono/diheme cytochrome c family protein
LRTQSFIRTFTFGLLGLGLTIACAAGCKKEEAKSVPLNAQEIRGQRIYAAACAQCHRADSEGPLNGPGLKNLYPKKFMPSGAPANDERLTDVIKHGRRSMPGFINTLEDKQVQDLVAYLKRL